MTTEIFRSAPEPEKRPAHYSLLDALLARRSRRFGKGMRLNGGPLAYASAHEPAPLSLAEEAALAFAASCPLPNSAASLSMSCWRPSAKR